MRVNKLQRSKLSSLVGSTKNNSGINGKALAVSSPQSVSLYLSTATFCLQTTVPACLRSTNRTNAGSVTSRSGAAFEFHALLLIFCWICFIADVSVMRCDSQILVSALASTWSVGNWTKTISSLFPVQFPHNARRHPFDGIDQER